MTLDTALERLRQIRATGEGAETTLTEGDTRFRLIDRIITNVLGWQTEEIFTEPHSESGYADYLLSHQGRNRLVIEAKRSGRSLVDTKSPDARPYALTGPALRSAQDGIRQARNYCQDHGVSFAALTNGYQWVGFLSIRTDGRAPREGKAITFPSLNAVENDFARFYDIFSREGVLKKLYAIHIQQAEGLELRHSEPMGPMVPERQKRLLEKSKISRDIEQVFRSFFSDISGDHDPEMLMKCFVESRESREADAVLSKITRNLINQINIIDSSKSQVLQERVKDAIELQRGEFVLLVGNKGAGKSTFADRFFKFILDKNSRAQCAIIRINLADSHGNMQNI